MSPRRRNIETAKSKRSKYRRKDSARSSFGQRPDLANPVLKNSDREINQEEFDNYERKR